MQGAVLGTVPNRRPPRFPFLEETAEYKVWGEVSVSLRQVARTVDGVCSDKCLKSVVYGLGFSARKNSLQGLDVGCLGFRAAARRKVLAEAGRGESWA